MLHLKCILAILSMSLLVAKSLHEPVTVNLHRDAILKTFKAALASDYMQTLVNDFATKAASHLIQEVKNKENQFYQYGVSLTKPTAGVQPSQQEVLQPDTDEQEARAVMLKEKKDFDPTIIDERQAYTLINDPSPDGDNLDTDVESLSDNESETKSDIPVIEVRKINGVYYRRLLGVISKKY